jgi:hypothetical protein
MPHLACNPPSLHLSGLAACRDDLLVGVAAYKGGKGCGKGDLSESLLRCGSLPPLLTASRASCVPGCPQAVQGPCFVFGTYLGCQSAPVRAAWPPACLGHGLGAGWLWPGCYRLLSHTARSAGVFTNVAAYRSWIDLGIKVRYRQLRMPSCSCCAWSCCGLRLRSQWLQSLSCVTVGQALLSDQREAHMSSVACLPTGWPRRAATCAPPARRSLRARPTPPPPTRPTLR